MGQRGEVWYVSSTLCWYDIRIGLLLVRSWARCDVFLWGGGDLGGVLCISLLWLRSMRCVYYASVYLC